MLDLPTYDPAAVAPLRDELTTVGFRELLTPESVEETFSQNDKTILLVVNSVCGCSAGSSRPGVCASLQNKLIPDDLVTAFAGQEKSSLNVIRQKYLSQFQPSSPFIALFKGSEVLFALERFDIQSMDAEEVSENCVKAYEEHCTKTGPSISAEDYAKLDHTIMCGSNVKPFQG